MSEAATALLGALIAVFIFIGSVFLAAASTLVITAIAFLVGEMVGYFLQPYLLGKDPAISMGQIFALASFTMAGFTFGKEIVKTTVSVSESLGK